MRDTFVDDIIDKEVSEINELTPEKEKNFRSLQTKSEYYI